MDGPRDPSGSMVSGVIDLGLFLALCALGWQDRPSEPLPAQERSAEEAGQEPSPTPQESGSAGGTSTEPTAGSAGDQAGGPEAELSPITTGQEDLGSAALQEPAGEQVVRRVGELLRTIERDRPDWARLESLGNTRGGREIPVLTVTDLTRGMPMERPAILLLEESGSSVQGAEELVEFARALLARAENEPELLSLLQRVVLQIAPMPDPDALVEPGPPAVRFSRNFPMGWQPETMVRGAGYRPLLLAGTQHFARLIEREQRLTAVIGVSPEYRAGRPYRGSELPREDLRLYEALARSGREDASLGLLPWSRLASSGGSFLDTVYQMTGVPCFALVLRNREVRPLSERLFELTRSLALKLPELRLELAPPRRLGSGLWQLDLQVQNTGRMPTVSELGRRRSRAADSWLSVKGATVVASSLGRRGGSAALDETAFHEEKEDLRIDLGGLDGGERIDVRLIVRGESEATLEVRVSAARAGRSMVGVTLLEEQAGD